MSKRGTRFPKSKSPVQIEEARQADGNVLLAQYRKHGTLPTVTTHNPLYGDFTGPGDLQAQIERVQDAHERFREFPASVRTAADNDPVRFLEMFDDPEQRAMLQDAGLQILDTPPDTMNPLPSEGGEGEEEPATTSLSDGGGDEGAGAGGQ